MSYTHREFTYKFVCRPVLFRVDRFAGGFIIYRHGYPEGEAAVEVAVCESWLQMIMRLYISLPRT